MTQFSTRPIERELIAQVLNVARRSPSGVNTQPWQVRVLTRAGTGTQAPCVLAFSIERLLGLGSQIDCGMFVASVQLAANARGLATVVTTNFGDGRHAAEQAMLIPDTELLLCTMQIGYPGSDAAPASPVKDIPVSWLGQV